MAVNLPPHARFELAIDRKWSVHELPALENPNPGHPLNPERAVIIDDNGDAVIRKVLDIEVAGYLVEVHNSRFGE